MTTFEIYQFIENNEKATNLINNFIKMYFFKERYSLLHIIFFQNEIKKIWISDSFLEIYPLIKKTLHILLMSIFYAIMIYMIFSWKDLEKKYQIYSTIKTYLQYNIISKMKIGFIRVLSNIQSYHCF